MKPIDFWPRGRLAVAVLASTVAIPLATSSSSAEGLQRAAPPQFVGDWNSRMEDCDTGNSDSALSIDPHWIRFYESGGPILAVVVMGKTHLSLIARLTSGEDGKTFDAVEQFDLSANGAVLKDVLPANPADQMVRYKCPHHLPPRGHS